MRSTHLLAFGLALILAGCGSRVNRAIEPSRWPLLAPDSISPRSVAQVVRAQYGTNSLTLMGALEITKSELTLVAVTSYGQRAYTIRYDGRRVSAERAAFVPDSIDSERLLADLQLAYWPLAVLEPAWRVAGLKVSEPVPGTRQLWRDQQLVAEVSYYDVDPWQGRLQLRNMEYGYSLIIDTAANEP